MYKSFTDYHLLQILTGFDAHNLPLDVFLSKYLKSHKAIGSKDRQKICTKLYALIRFRSLIDLFIEKPITWEKRIFQLPNLNLEQIAQDPDLPSHVKISFPKNFFDLLKADFTEEQATAICQELNQEAPFTIRSNTLKISRDTLFQKLSERFPVYKNEFSQEGITFQKRTNLFTLPEFKAGFFEVQDEGSQLIANLVDATPKNLVLDFCAGAGGKTLAFAPKMKGQGQIFLFDIRPKALADAKKRLKRAGIQNAQIVLSLEKLKKQKPFDWVLLDVPCSGSGTIRRNPDMKWKFEPKDLDELVQKQKDIFSQAFPLLKKGGRLVFATCSLFKKENEEQIAFFLKNYPVQLEEAPLRLLPKKGGHDGFFGAVLQKL